VVEFYRSSRKGSDPRDTLSKLQLLCLLLLFATQTPGLCGAFLDGPRGAAAPLTKQSRRDRWVRDKSCATLGSFTTPAQERRAALVEADP